MTEQYTTRVADAAQAKQAMERWLGPAFDAVTETYMARLAEVAAAEPWAKDKIVKLALAARIAKEVRAQIEAVVADGRVALDQQRHRDRIENIPHEQRKVLGIGY